MTSHPFFNALSIWGKYPLTGAQMFLFRREASVDRIPESWKVRLTADSRYRLFVNGHRVGDGPCRPSPGIRYAEERDIAPFLKPGVNVLLVWAAHYPADAASNEGFRGGPVSVITGDVPFFALEDERGVWTTNALWKCRRADGYVFTHIVSQLSFMESVDLSGFPPAMYTSAYDDSEWETASPVSVNTDSFVLAERSIPFPFEEKSSFADIVRSGGDSVNWFPLISGEDVILPPHTDEWVELAAQAHETAYPCLQISGGAGSRITVTYAECYKQARSDGTLYKARRDDAGERAVLDGFADCVIGDGSEQQWTPFWYRAFRLVRLHIRTAEAPLRIRRFCFFRTGYPLPMEAAFACDRADYNAMWDISRRTLRNCMYETYMDCPYYEQLQYVMDTVLQMQFTAKLSHDRELTRRAITDFFRAQQPNGLIPANSPAKLTQVIPGFALFAVYMLELYQNRYDDFETVAGYLPAVDRILEFFEKARNGDGLITLPDDWSFVDWVAGWKNGTPLTAPGHGNVLYTMMYAAALRTASRLYRMNREEEKARRLCSRADALCAVLRAVARDADGLFWNERPGTGKSQHGQLWAVLSETVTGSEAAALMERAWADKTLSPVSYCMVWLLLRAMEKVGLYEKTEAIWEKYRSLLPLHITTWPEDDLDARSDCHAWSAVALYEFTAHGLGARESADGSVLRIHPQMLWLRHCRGSVATKFGTVSVCWSLEHSMFTLTVQAEKAIPLFVQLPNGESHTLTAQAADYTVRL